MNQLHGTKNNKVILFTGCTGVLGSYFVGNYGRSYTIVGVALNAPYAYDGSYDFFKGDITEDTDAIVNYVLEKYDKIDVLVNNAVMFDRIKLENKARGTFEREVKTNLIAPLELSNTILRNFWSKRSRKENVFADRCIINISSIAGTYFNCPGELASYSALKVALNMFTKHMASGYAEYGVRVNAVAPETFPHYVPLERVGNAIIDLIEDNSNGAIMVLPDEDKNNDYLFEYKN